MDKNTTHPWAFETSTLFSSFNTDIDGLSNEEAERRLKDLGKNKITKGRQVDIITLLAHQMINPLVGLLYAAVIFSILLDKPTEAIFVGVAILVNIILGFFQEYKANNAIKKLETYITHQSRVRRNGAIESIETEDIALGDIVILKHGDRVGADIRLLKADMLETDEAVLTGESLPVKKNLDLYEAGESLADRGNMVWAGSTITQGEAEGIAISTGNNTELGKIAGLVEHTKDTSTPLEKEVSRLARIISIFLVVLGILIFGIGIYAGFPMSEILLISIAVIVSAVPGSIPVAMSVVLAVGAETLAKKQGVVRKMSATETLGSTTLILTDKTGTLTEASLKLVDIDIFKGKEKARVLAEAALNVDIAINKETGAISGRPVEVALVTALQNDKGATDFSEQTEIVETLPFSSEYKFSAIFFKQHGKFYVSLLGAPDILVEKTKLAPNEKDKVTNNIAAYAQTGERILGVVSKEIIPDFKSDAIIKENTFDFDGLIRFRDPVRKSVHAAATNIVKAGVNVIIVTGDHPGTAKAVAQEIGLWEKDSLSFTGKELENMTDRELIPKLPYIKVFARMTPEQKLRLVELFMQQGEVVAVTGDGVNDAPALKQASIGVAMGSGTDVARASADLIVLDNNFETITQAIFEGRSVLQKMRSVITYLLADSFDELMLVGGSIILAVPLPITALQILFVKFFSDIFPAMGFTFEKTNEFGFTQKPPKTSLFDRKIKIFTLGRGLISSLILFGIYLFLLHLGLEKTFVNTFIFASFASYILFLAFSMRNLDKSIFEYKMFSNKWLTLGVVVGFLTISAAIYYAPLSKLLNTTPLPLPWFLGVIGVGIFNLVLMETLKKIVRE